MVRYVDIAITFAFGHHLPAAAGRAGLLFLRSDDHVWIRRIALAVSIAEFVISLRSCCADSNRANAGYQFEEMHNWIGDAIHYHIGVDGISLFLVLLTTFLTPLAILCSWNRSTKT